MKNAIPPTLALASLGPPVRPKTAMPSTITSTSAPIGANPVPPDTPTYPGLYHGALAFGSPRGSKHQRVHRFPSPNTTPDDDQDQPIKKKRRTSIKKGPQAAYHANNSDDNFDQIIQEDRNLHFHERNNKIAAPSPQGTNISHRATTPTKMAAKMQATSPTTPTTLTTTDDNKKGTTTEPEHQLQSIMHLPMITTRTLDLQMIMRRTTTGLQYYNYQLQQSTNFNNMDHTPQPTSRTPTPPKHHHRNLLRLLRLPRSAGIALADFIPVVALARRDPKSIHTTIRRRCNTSLKTSWI
ncbi:hypothetical protein MHU86_16275 [Fragilaria crotonensis]|nr:hypothetical protein MHU86_16275 [Fragilaria crotonensis]